MSNPMFDRILAELNSMRSRLNEIEQQLRDESPSASSHEAVSQPQPFHPRHQPREQPQAISYTYVPPTQAYYQNASTSSSSSSGMGTGKFLGIVGVFCFVLAASYFIELAIDSGWLTPVRQVVLAALFGFSLIVAGYFLRNRDESYLSMLPGAGIVILFLTSYGAGFIYDLVDQPFTLGLITATSVLSIILYFIFHRIYYVLIAAVGAYICPLLMDKAVVPLTDFMGIFLVWDITFAYLSMKLKRREVNLVASYLALMIFFQQTFFDAKGADMAMLAYFQLAQFVIFFASMIKHSIDQKQPLNSAEAWAFFPLLVLFYELEYIILNKLSDNLAPILSLVFAGLIFGFYFLSKKALSKKTLESGPVVHAFCAIVLFQSIYCENFSSMHSPWFAVALLLFLPFFFKKEKFEKNILAFLIAFVVIVCEYYKLITKSYGVNQNGFYEYLLLNFIVGGIMSVMYWKSQKNPNREGKDWFILLFFAYVQAMAGLVRVAEMIGTAMSLDNGKRFIVSILWGLLAIVVLFLGKAKRDAFFARTSLLIFAISIMKVFFYDISRTGPLVKILCLVVLGAVLYFGGYLYRHIEKWEK